MIWMGTTGRWCGWMRGRCRGRGAGSAVEFGLPCTLAQLPGSCVVLLYSSTQPVEGDLGRCPRASRADLSLTALEQLEEVRCLHWLNSRWTVAVALVKSSDGRSCKATPTNTILVGSVM